MLNKAMSHWVVVGVLYFFMVSTTLSLVSCGGGGGGTSQSSQERVAAQLNAQLVLDTSIPASSSGDPAHIGSIQNFQVTAGDGTVTSLNIVYWGTKDVNGQPTSITQAVAYSTDLTQTARVFFDGNQLPVVLEDVVNGTTAFISYASDHVTFSFYDSSNNLIAEKTITKSGNNYVVAGVASFRGAADKNSVLDTLDQTFGRQLLADFCSEVASKLITTAAIGAMLGATMPAVIIAGAVALTGYILFDGANLAAASQDQETANYLQNLPVSDTGSVATLYSWPNPPSSSDSNPDADIPTETLPTQPTNGTSGGGGSTPSTTGDLINGINYWTGTYTVQITESSYPNGCWNGEWDFGDSNRYFNLYVSNDNTISTPVWYICASYPNDASVTVNGNSFSCESDEVNTSFGSTTEYKESWSFTVNGSSITGVATREDIYPTGSCKYSWSFSLAPMP